MLEWAGPHLGILPPEQLGDEFHLLRPGEQGGKAIPAEHRSVNLEKARRKGVEGRGLDRDVGAADGSGDPAPQIRCPAPGECEDEEMVGMDAVCADQVGGAPDEELGLAGARPCHHQLRAVGCGDRIGPVVRCDLPVPAHHVDDRPAQAASRSAVVHEATGTGSSPAATRAVVARSNGSWMAGMSKVWVMASTYPRPVTDS